MACQARGRRFGRRDRAFDAVLDLGQFIDEKIGGRTGADTDNFTVDHIINGGAGYGLLQFVLGHDIQAKVGNGAILTDCQPGQPAMMTDQTIRYNS